MNQLFVSFKREYWEYRNILWGIPLVLSSVLLLISVLMTLNAVDSPNASTASTIDNTESTVHPDSPSTAVSKPELNIEQFIEQQRTQSPNRFMGLYLGFAWLTALYYLLASLYNDRQDNSILYWKSLPVSDTRTVLVKMAFGSLAFVSAFILVGFLLYALMSLLGLGFYASLPDSEQWQFVSRSFDFRKLVLWPWLALLVGICWGAPLLAYLLLVSAVAQRSPFLLLIVPGICLAMIEARFTETSPITNFFIAHSPLSIIHHPDYGQNAQALIHSYFSDQAGQMLLGAVLAVAFIGATIWFRKYHIK